MGGRVRTRSEKPNFARTSMIYFGRHSIELSSVASIIYTRVPVREAPHGGQTAAGKMIFGRYEEKGATRHAPSEHPGPAPRSGQGPQRIEHTAGR